VAKKTEKSAKFRVWEKVPERSIQILLLLCIGSVGDSLDPFTRFDRRPASYRQTDRRTPGHTIHSAMHMCCICVAR